VKRRRRVGLKGQGPRLRERPMHKKRRIGDVSRKRTMRKRAGEEILLNPWVGSGILLLVNLDLMKGLLIGTIMIMRKLWLKIPKVVALVGLVTRRL